MVRDRAPVLRVFHAVDDRAVAARGLAEAAAVIARGERAELAIDEGDELARQIIGVIADRRGVDVLVAAERREAIGKNEDRRPHPAIVDQPRGALGHVVGEGRQPVWARPEPVNPTRSNSTGKRRPGRAPARARSSYCGGSQTASLRTWGSPRRLSLSTLDSCCRTTSVPALPAKRLMAIESPEVERCGIVARRAGTLKRRRRRR